MDYEKFYDMVREEIQRLMEMDMYKDDYRLIKALAALYELQDYLANRIAELGMETREMEYIGGEAKKGRHL